MQLVEALILLFAGLVPGVWVTLVDVYAVGASVFSTRIALWMLLIVLVSTNLRHRRQATWGSAWLSLGCVESYYLSSSYTFEGLARSTVVPLALLSVVAAGVAWVSWTAKHERGTFGLALKALVLVATLVACVATHDALSALDLVCAALIAYCLFFMRSRRIALERHRPDTPLALSGAPEDVVPERHASGSRRGTTHVGERSSTGAGEPSERVAAGSRPASRPSRERRRATGSERRPTRRATGRRWSAAGEVRAVPSTKREGHTGRATAQAPSERSAQRGSRAVTSLKLQRNARPTRSSATSGTRGSASSEPKAKTAEPRRPEGSHPSQQRRNVHRGRGAQNVRPAADRTVRGPRPAGGNSSRPAKGARGKAVSQGSSRASRTQRPTKRTGGAVPEANRMRSSSSDGHNHANGKPHRRSGSSGSGSRR